jgi:hypothetical protein
MANSTLFFSKYDTLMSFSPEKTFTWFANPPFFGHEETKFLPKTNENHVESYLCLIMKKKKAYMAHDIV